MKAFVIPADSSERVREIDFDQDETWRYVVTKYRDPAKPPWDLTKVAFVTKENAPGDYLLRNSRASDYLKNHSERRNSSKDLYGDVVVLGYDRALNVLTDLPWPHSPEDFEDLLTRIVTPPQRIRSDEEDDRIIAEWERLHPDPPFRDIFERGGAPDRS
jgi:hypothetical protein